MIRTLTFTILLAVGIASTAQAKARHCTVRVHAETNANDGSVFATPVTTPLTGRTIFIEKIPSISERDVAAFRAYSAKDGSFGVLLQLNDHGRLALETMSMEHRGNTLVVLVNGRAVTEMLVDRSVSDGQLYIATGLAAADVQAMQKDWPQIGAKKR